MTTGKTRESVFANVGDLTATERYAPKLAGEPFPGTQGVSR